MSGLKSLILPGITLALYQLTLIMRLVRSEMIDVLSTRLHPLRQGAWLPSRYIHFRLALRNALMPVITVTGLQIGSLIAFAIVTETVFQWPGMGLLFIQAVSFVDIPVMAAYLLFVGFLFVVINMVGRYPLRGGRSPTAREVAHEHARRIVPACPPHRCAAFRAHRRRCCRWCSSAAPLLAPWIAPYRSDRPCQLRSDRRRNPAGLHGRGDPRFLLGTDNQGRDLLSAILYGARVSIAIGGGAVAASRRPSASFSALLAGYFGGWVDALIMRIGDVILSFPTILLALLVSGIARAVFPDAGTATLGAVHPDRRHRNSRMGAICAHGQRGHDGGGVEGLCARRPRSSACRRAGSCCATSCPTS